MRCDKITSDQNNRLGKISLVTQQIFFSISTTHAGTASRASARHPQPQPGHRSAMVLLRTPAMSLLTTTTTRSVLGRTPAAAATTTLALRSYATPAADTKHKISASSPSKTAGRGRARYQVRPPRYYRGPLHPIQPPKPSAPNSREFVPGPFSRERKASAQPQLGKRQRN